MVRFRVIAIMFTMWLGALCPLAAGQEPMSPQNRGTPVVFDGKSLFSLYANLGKYTPFERAIIITQRLQALAQDTSFSPNAITVADNKGKSEVLAGSVSLVTVQDGDAQALGRSRQVLAAEYSRKIQQAILDYRHDRALKNLLLGVLYVVLSTGVLIVLLKLLSTIYRRVTMRLRGASTGRLRASHRPILEILATPRILDALRALLNLLGLALTLLLLYLYLIVVCSFFPWTRGYAATLLAYIGAQLRLVWNAVSVQLPNLLLIVIILVITYFVLKVVRFVFRELEKGTPAFTGFDTELAAPTYRIVRFLILAFAAVAIFPYIPGSHSPAFEGISVFLGLLLSLGSTSVVSNLVAGYVLTYMRPFHVGDRVKIADTIGDVIERTDLVTRIRTVKNEDVTIPNASALGAHIVNYSAMAREEGLILHTSITIGYDAPWRQVQELLLAAARATEHILAEPPPFVLQTSLNDYHITYEINAYTDRPNLMARIYSELHQNIQDHFNTAGVEIMSPAYTNLRDGNQTTLPTDYLPSDYEAPALRVLPIQQRNPSE
jgi:small-conductance mechanosensitive channel